MMHPIQAFADPSRLHGAAKIISASFRRPGIWSRSHQPSCTRAQSASFDTFYKSGRRFNQAKRAEEIAKEMARKKV